MKYLSTTVIAGTLLLGLNACGGGDDGDGGSSPVNTVPTKPISLDNTNAEQVSGLAYASADGQITTGSTTGGLLPLAAQIQTGEKDNTSLYDLTTLTVELFNDGQNGSQVVAGVTQSQPCSVSGDVTITVDENAGTASMSFDQCGEDDFVINGSFSLSGITQTGTQPNVIVSMTISFNNVSVTEAGVTASINGSYNATVARSDTGITHTLSGTLLTLSEGGQTHSLSNFTFTETTVNATLMTTTTADYTLSSTLINGRVTVTTQTPFETDFSVSYPHSGVLVIQGADSSIRLTVLGDENSLPLNQQVQLEIDANGDTNYETTVTTSWDTLED